MRISAAKRTLIGSDDKKEAEERKEKEMRAKRKRIINYVFGTGEYPASDITGFQGLKISDDRPDKLPDHSIILATTRKETAENEDDKLVQKIEKIEETPLVEAETPNICPPETNPKILGKTIAARHLAVSNSRYRRSRFSRTPFNKTTENPTLQYLRKRTDLFDKTWQPLNSLSKHKTVAFYPKSSLSKHKAVAVFPKNSLRKQKTVDFYPEDDILKNHLNLSTNDSNNKPGASPDCEWAKRLNQKSNQIDERFLEEMEKLGVPSAGTKSHNTLNGEIVQADIMTKSKKTVDKPEMDLESRQLDEVDRKRLCKIQVDEQDDSKPTLTPNQRNSKSPSDKESSDMKLPRNTMESNITTLKYLTCKELAGLNVNSQSKSHGAIPGGTPTLAGHLALIDPYDKKTLARNKVLVSPAETARIAENATTPVSAQESSRSDSPMTVAESTENTSATENTLTDNQALMTSHLKEQTVFNVQQKMQESPKEVNIIDQSDVIELEKDKPDIQVKPKPVEQRKEEKSLASELKAEATLPPPLQLKFKTAYETEKAPQTFKPDFFNLQMTEPQISDTTVYQKVCEHMISSDFFIDEQALVQPKTVEPVSVEPITEDADKTKEVFEQTKEEISKYYSPPVYEKIKCNISATVGPLPLIAPKQAENIPLSELLARVRMYSPMEISKTMDFAQIDPEAKKKTPPPPCCPKPPPCCPPPPPCPKPPPCYPPPPPCCPKPPPCCPPPPPCCPKPPPCCPPPPPCCPKPPPCCPPPCCPPPCCPPPPCPPPPPVCPNPPPRCPPPPCPPPKKCAARNGPCSLVSVTDSLTKILSTTRYSKTLSPWMMLPPHLLEFSIAEPVETETVEEGSSDHMVLAREFEPWTPIPGWPHPKKIEKKELVCPKDGCRVQPPPKDGDFCKPTQKPCTHFPKRLTFLSEKLLPENMRKKVFDLGNF